MWFAIAPCDIRFPIIRTSMNKIMTIISTEFPLSFSFPPNWLEPRRARDHRLLSMHNPMLMILSNHPASQHTAIYDEVEMAICP